MRHKILLALILIFIIVCTNAQNVGIGTSSPNALLDVNATNNGILIPRVALTATNNAGPLTLPTTSTLVYNTAIVVSGATSVSPGFYYWNGSAWVRVIDNSSLTGATTDTLSLLGNTLTSKVNNVASAQSLIGLSLSGDVTGTLAASTVGKIQGTPVTISSLANGNLLQYNSAGTDWVNVTPGSAVFTAGTGLGWSGSTLNNTGVTSVATGSGLTGGPITTTGTIGIATGGVTNAMLTNSSITVTAGTGMSGGGAVSLGGSIILNNTGVTSVATGSGLTGGTITTTGTIGIATGGVTNAMLANSTISGIGLGNNLNALTIGTGLSGSSYNGSSAVTIAIATAYLTPPGTIVAYGGTTAPTGWLLCNGTSYATATYPSLFAAISYNYGGSGANFNVPDLRGVFLRGVDGGVGRDPDASSRTALYTGGNTGANIGSYQADQFASHTHFGNVSGGVQLGNPTTIDIYNTGGLDAGNNFQYRMSYSGGTESRGKNVYVNYIIKY